MRMALVLAVGAFLTSTALAADGFYRVERRDGRWTVLTPKGHPFRWFGINHFSPHNGHGKTDTYGRFLGMTNGSAKAEIAWRCGNTAFLKDCGFTLVSLARWEAKQMPRLVDLCGATTICLDLGQHAATEKDASRFITPYRRRACSAMPNVWHPDFERTIDELAKPICSRFRDNKSLVGYYLDNELAWWGNTVKETGLFDRVRKLDRNHTAFHAQLSYLKRLAKDDIRAFDALWDTHFKTWGDVERGTYLPDKTPEQLAAKRGFLRELADRYFSVCVAAVRKYDPNHLVLGCRFAGFSGADKVVWEAAGKHCDVISLNCYPTYDIRRKLLLDQHVRDQMKRTLENTVPLLSIIDEYARASGRPVVITEWSFPADDISGLGNARGAGCRMATQRLRAEAAAFTLQQFASLPYIVGCDWYRWVDCPGAGVRVDCPEDCNYGIVNERNEPYPLLVEVFKAAKGR